MAKIEKKVAEKFVNVKVVRNFASTHTINTMTKPICIKRSVTPDDPCPDFNTWAVYVHGLCRQYEISNQLNTHEYGKDTLEETH